MIENQHVIFLCFPYLDDGSADRKCRTLKQHNIGPLNDIETFEFETEFLLENVDNDSRDSHGGSTIANYQGFPIVLGGFEWMYESPNRKLEIFDTVQNRWLQKKEYPYTDKFI